MKPVLIQTLMKRNKGKYQAEPFTKEETEKANNVAASLVFWFVAFLVITGLLLA